MKYYFIINPKAGSDDNFNIIKKAINDLEFKDECIIYLTKEEKDATRYVKETAQNNPKEKMVFVACGGDGTINEVFQGAIGQENAIVSVYPCGSGNDFVKTFGGADRFKDLKTLLSYKPTKIDALKVNGQYSFNVTNFGFDTTVAITVNTDRAKTGKGSKSSYTKGIIKALITSMNNKAKVWVDGELINPQGNYLLCTLGNCQYVGGSFKCAPKASAQDGLIEVCLVKPISRLKFVTLLKPYTNGQHLDDDTYSDVMVYRQGKNIKIEAEEGFAYSLDGEIIYENKVNVDIVEKIINVILPFDNN